MHSQNHTRQNHVGHQNCCKVKYMEDFQFNFSDFHLHKKTSRTNYLHATVSINEWSGRTAKSLKKIATACRGGIWTSTTKTKLTLETQEPQHEGHYSSLSSAFPSHCMCYYVGPTTWEWRSTLLETLNGQKIPCLWWDFVLKSAFQGTLTWTT